MTSAESNQFHPSVTGSALRFEEGRSGVWLDVHSAIDHPKLSSWHECVLRAWRRSVPAGLGGSTGTVRADFTTPPDWTP